jgi:hypothetical protein
MFSSPFILFENNISPNTMVLSTAEVAASSVSPSPNSSPIPPSSKSSSSNLEYKKNESSLSSIDKTFDSNFISSAAALKEWAIVCKAIEDGKQVLLFRKGGIMEYRNGFELKHKVFFLFPTFEHQSIDSIQNEYREELEVLKQQQQQQQQKDNTQSLNQKENNTSNEKNSKVTQDNINISTFVEITHFIEINDISKLEKLEKYHIWNLDYVKMRFNYNPKKPLYLLMLRAYKLNEPIEIQNKPEWSGCKSWIQFDLKDVIIKGNQINDLSQHLEYLKSISKPCIDDITFNNLTLEIRSIFK